MKYNFHFIEKYQFDPQKTDFCFFIYHNCQSVLYKILHILTSSIIQYFCAFFCFLVFSFFGVMQQNANARATRKLIIATHTEETWIIRLPFFEIIINL
jgi:hypothetical protein